LPTGTVIPNLPPQFFANNGDVAAGYQLFVYSAGTSTKVNSYSDVTLATPNTNPIVLDSAGRATIFLTPGVSYKFILAPPTDTDPPTSPTWTRDNIIAVPASNVDVDVVAVAGEALSAGDCVYLSEGDGGRTAGRWYKADADLTYASTEANALGFATAAISSAATGSVRVAGRVTGLSALTTGSVYYISATAGSITTSAPTNARAVGVADSTTTLIVSQWVPVPEATTTVPGVVSTGTQTFGGNKTFAGDVQVGGDLTFDAGAGTENAHPSGIIELNVTPVGNVGGGTDDLMTYTLPANTLSRNLMALRITARGTIAGADANRTVLLSFGGTTISFNGILDSAVSSAYTKWWFEALIVRTGVGAQTYFEAGGQSYINTFSTGNDPGHKLNGTLSKDETAAIIIKVTGNSANVTNNDITQELLMVEVLN